MTEESMIDEYSTESSKLADILGKDILKGTYEGGSRLPQRTIAERYHATTIVVREAFRILERQGLITIIPRYGALVEKATPERLEGKYFVREALEGMAARLACERGSVGDKAILAELARQCDNTLPFDGPSAEQKAALHLKLHEFILEMADCKELMELVKNIYLNTMLLSNAIRIEWSKDSQGWHSFLADSIIKGTPDEAEATMRLHVRRGYQMEREALEKQGDL